ncbi:MAG: LCP family protein [Patescibacteria group bacterium]|jgi:LCP family protein required for cell wall assembly
MQNDDSSVDFLQQPSPILSERHARSKISSVTKALSVGAMLFVVIAAFASTKITHTTAEEPEAANGFSLFSSLRRLVVAPEKALSGEDGDRVNVLLLGVSGAGHAGPQLTDTMILASYKPSTNEVGMISIPRDLTVEIPGYGYRKINAVNALAEMNESGSGVTAAANTVQTIFGQTVDYAVRVDFNGFEEIVDDIGGIDVYIDQSFTDTTYPIDDVECNVTTVSFSEGWAHMDGKTALQFARSRHGDSGEGSDFARAARQQKILLAVKDRALSLNVLLNPAKLNNIISTIRKNVSTDMSLWEMMRLAEYVPKIDRNALATRVLDTAPGSPLYSTMINGAYVILPRNEDWSDLKLIAKNIFDDKPMVTSQEAALPSSPTGSDGVRIEIQNGTPTFGLAARTAELLESSGFTIALVSNAAERDYQKTMIFDYTNGKKAEELASLQKYLDADVIMTPQGYLSSDAVVPDGLGTVPDVSGEDIDFLIIIGENGMDLVLN